MTEIQSPSMPALLFLVFNRPYTTKQVWEWIRTTRPAKLYIAADGARTNKIGELELVREVREMVNSGIDWNVDIKTLFRDKNMGCRNAVSSAIDWFFENEEEGIILEDDCLPGADFLPFCKNLLAYYRNNEKVMHVSGNNFLREKIEVNESYYFTKFTHIWGWATWRRAWKYYDVQMNSWPEKVNGDLLKNIFDEYSKIVYFEKKFSQVYNVEIDTWDFQWTYAVWVNNGIAINPAVNLVKNIGFDANATHTQKEMPWLVNEILSISSNLIHPSEIIVNDEADNYTSSFLFPTKFEKIKLKLGIY